MRTIHACAIALLALAAGGVAAQDFPSRPVRLVVPFPPGGPLDVAGRMISRELQERWGQPVVVENKPGGSIGAETVAKAPKDGYMLMINGSSPFVTLPQMARVGYDPIRDFVGVTQTTESQFALIANAKSGIASLQQLIDEARKAPGKLNYGSAGNGAGQHLYFELLKTAAGIDLTHIPYKGAAPSLQALISGEVPVIFENIITASSMVKSGRARALMVTGAKPIEHLPGAVPFDVAFPGLGIQTWHGIFAPSGTPRPVVDKIAADVRYALQVPTVVSRFGELGIEPTGVSGDAFNAMVKSDFERWGVVIRKNNLRAD
jgi:tripartite-type tricarboxylate transporter receptor subunit TctC